jgi:hypothetical protein
MAEKTPNTERHEYKGWNAGLHGQPDCRHHYNEPYRTAYARGYDNALRYLKCEGIDFWTTKASIAFRFA